MHWKEFKCDLDPWFKLIYQLFLSYTDETDAVLRAGFRSIVTQQVRIVILIKENNNKNKSCFDI